MVARDFETPADDGGNNVYDYTLTVTDADGNTDDQAVILAVTNVNDAGNHSFETGGVSSTGTWSSLPNVGDWVGAAHPYSILDISGPNNHFPTSNAPDGDNVLNLSVVGLLTQDRSYTINTGDLISLSFYIGNSAAIDPGNITATIMLNGSNASPNLVATNTAADGGWALKTVEWTANAGGNLSISFSGSRGAWLDNVSVDVTH